jgi:hypothetical protein
MGIYRGMRSMCSAAADGQFELALINGGANRTGHRTLSRFTMSWSVSAVLGTWPMR